jgi:hypothetical protein
MIGIALSHREGPGAAAFLRCKLTIRSARSGALLGLDGPATGDSSIERQLCEVMRVEVRRKFGMWLLRSLCLSSVGRVLRSTHTVHRSQSGTVNVT